MRKTTYFGIIVLAIFAMLFSQLMGVVESRKAPSPEESLWEPEIYTGEVEVDWVEILAPEAGIWSQTASTGKVFPGQVLFTGPVSLQDEAFQVELLSCALEAEQLVLPRRQEQLHHAISSGDMEGAMALIYEQASQDTLTQAQQRLSQLSTQCTCVTAPVGGIFLPGGEYPVLGKIITTEAWNLTLILPYGMETEQQVTLELLSGIFQQVDCTVEEAVWEEDGCHVRLSCEEGLAQVGNIRNLTVKILSE